MNAEKVNRVEKQIDHHLNNRKCESCTVKGKSYADCFDYLFTDALSVIRELKAENEQLKAEQPKHGHWIIDEYEYLDCSCCGESYYTGCDCTEDAKHRLKTGDVYKFCPYCGARMDGDQE